MKNRNDNVWLHYGPHFLCWYSGVVSFNTWPISSWEENKCCYKLSKCTKWHLFHRWKLWFWVKIVVILSVAQLVTTVIFISAWDKSSVKWDNSQNSTQKMRTHVTKQKEINQKFNFLFSEIMLDVFYMQIVALLLKP